MLHFKRVHRNTTINTAWDVCRRVLRHCPVGCHGLSLDQGLFGWTDLPKGAEPGLRGDSPGIQEAPGLGGSLFETWVTCCFLKIGTPLGWNAHLGFCESPNCPKFYEPTLIFFVKQSAFWHMDRNVSMIQMYLAQLPSKSMHIDLCVEMQELFPRNHLSIFERMLQHAMQNILYILLYKLILHDVVFFFVSWRACSECPWYPWCITNITDVCASSFPTTSFGQISRTSRGLKWKLHVFPVELKYRSIHTYKILWKTRTHTDVNT